MTKAEEIETMQSITYVYGATRSLFMYLEQFTWYEFGYILITRCVLVLRMYLAFGAYIAALWKQTDGNPRTNNDRFMIFACVGVHGRQQKNHPLNATRFSRPTIA